jgi:hypothetical protein
MCSTQVALLASIEKLERERFIRILQIKNVFVKEPFSGGKLENVLKNLNNCDLIFIQPSLISR